MSKPKNKKEEDSAPLDIQQELKLMAHQLTVKEDTIDDQIDMIRHFKAEYLRVEKELENHKKNMKNLYENEQKLKILSDTIKNLEEEIHNLNEEIKTQKKIHKDEVESLKKELDGQIKKLIEKNELMEKKIESVNNLEKLKDQQSEQIKNMEEIIARKDNEYLEKLNKKTLKNSLKFTELKSKMIENISKTEKNINQLSVEHVDITTKLTLLQNNHLLIELEYQSQQIEEITKKNVYLEKMNFELKRDNEIHREVESKLVQKNNKLQEKILNLNEIINNLKKDQIIDTSPLQTETIEIDENKPISTEKTNNQIKTKFKSLLFGDDENSFLKGKLDRSEVTKKGFEKNSIISETNKGNEKRYLDIEKLLESKRRDLEITVINFQALQQKFEILNKKYQNLFNLFDTALEKLSEDEEFKTLTNNEYTLQADIIKNCDFQNLSIDQKCIVVSIFLKILLKIVDFIDLGKNHINSKSSNVSKSLNLNFFFGKSQKFKENQLIKNTLLTSMNNSGNKLYYYSISGPVSQELPRIKPNRSTK